MDKCDVMEKKTIQACSYDWEFVRTHQNICVQIELNDEERKYLKTAYRVIEPTYGKYNAPDVIAFTNDGVVKTICFGPLGVHAALSAIIDTLTESDEQ